MQSNRDCGSRSAVVQKEMGCTERHTSQLDELEVSKLHLASAQQARPPSLST